MTAPVVLVERHGRVALITLNRPHALNALNTQLLEETTAAATAFDTDPDVGAIVFTGSERAFAAGADVKDMAGRSVADITQERWLSGWDAVAALRTPTIAAVSGLALGGGCELAMMCDLIVAGRSAQFGQPEVKLGLIPGLGGSQRLARAIGAEEAERCGLVSRVVADDAVLSTALEAAATIADYSRPVVRAAKDVVSVAFETSLAEGVRYERSQFYAAFALEDSAEGIAAFSQKRSPRFRHR
jgi:enoyl-CoA hydratase